MTDPNHPVASPGSKGKVWKWVLLSILIAIGGLVLYRGWASNQKRVVDQRKGRSEIPVQVIPAARADLTYYFSTTGDIAPLMQVDLFPKVSGYLERINVNLGDPVRQGQIVAQIEKSEFAQKVKEAEAKVSHAKAQFAELQAGSRTEDIRQAEEAVKQAESRFNNARLQKERIEALFKRQVISKKEMDASEMEFNVAEAQLESSQQHLKMLREGAREEVRTASQAKLREMEAILAQEQTHLQNATITAPFSGEITRRHVDAGALVSPSTPLATLAHTEILKVTANVLEKDISLARPGMKAKIQTEAFRDKKFEGMIVRINSALDLATRTLQTEIHIPNSERLLKPGMFARIEIALTTKKDAVTIPRVAVIDEGKEQAAFVIENNQAVRRPLMIGIEEGERVEVLEGISEGEQVVVKGQGSLKDRTPVRIIQGD